MRAVVTLAVLVGLIAGIAGAALDSIPFMGGAAVVIVAVGVVIAVRRRSDDEEVTDLARSHVRVNPANLPMPEAPYQHVHRPIGEIEYGPRTAIGHAPPIQVPPAFGRVNSSDHEAPTVYGTRGTAGYVAPAYLKEPYVHEPYVQQRARSFPPVPRFAPSGPADDGPTTYDPAAQLRAEQAHAELARGAAPTAGWRKK